MSVSELAIARAAKAGQALAIRWGHQPWSHPWADLVARTIIDASQEPEGELELAQLRALLIRSAVYVPKGAELFIEIAAAIRQEAA